MPDKKPTNNARRTASIIEARAGLIPESDHIENELNTRVALIARAVRVYSKLTRCRDDLAIIDILNDLRHYCDTRALAFEKLDAAAREYYLEDAAENPWKSRPSAADQRDR